MAAEMSMKLDLIELYDLIGDDKGISFLYDELPGIVVTIGFTKEETIEEDTDDTESKLH